MSILSPLFLAPFIERVSLSKRVRERGGNVSNNAAGPRRYAGSCYRTNSAEKKRRQERGKEKIH